MFFTSLCSQREKNQPVSPKCVREEAVNIFILFCLYLPERIFRYPW